MSGVEVLTFGCRLNGVEAEAMRAAATAAGHRDLVVVNSCAVTAEAARQARQAVRRARAARPNAEIVVTGCAAETEPARFETMPEVGRRIPNALKTRPETWAEPPSGAGRHRLSEQQAEGQPGLQPAPLVDPVHTRGFVEIQNGCDHRCTFCIIPFGRGASRCRAPDTIVAEIDRRVEAGTREIVLTGVDITSYDGGGLSLGGLVRRVLAAVPDLERLRLSSIDCIEADDALLEAMAHEPRLMPHLHVSLQSGSDLILKRMKRRHARADAIAFCAALRAARPGIVFGADLIAGFPTETEAQFGETLDLVEACGLTSIHVFPFSPRPGTPAARMPAVPGEVVKARAARLRSLGAARLAQHLDRQIGRRLRVLTERGGRGRAEDFSAVRVGEEPSNRMIEVLVTSHDGRELMGRPQAAGGATGSCGA